MAYDRLTKKFTCDYTPCGSEIRSIVFHDGSNNKFYCGEQCSTLIVFNTQKNLLYQLF